MKKKELSLAENAEAKEMPLAGGWGRVKEEQVWKQKN